MRRHPKEMRYEEPSPGTAFRAEVPLKFALLYEIQRPRPVTPGRSGSATACGSCPSSTITLSGILLVQAGSLRHEDICDSLSRFGREVIPKFF